MFGVGVIGQIGGIAGSGDPTPPVGYVFLLDVDGYYLVDIDGYYLLESV